MPAPKRNFKSKDEAAIERAEMESALYAANLKWAMETNQPAGIVLQYRRWTADAAITLGEFEQAEMLVRDVPELADLATELDTIREAITKADSERCGCVHTVDARWSERETGKQMRVPNYVPGRRIKSKAHGGFMVRVHRCALCGHENAAPGFMDDLQATAYSLRNATDKMGEQGDIKPDHLLLPNA